MGVKIMAVVLCAVGSCSLFDVKIGAQTVQGSYTVNSVAGGGCGGETGSAFKDIDLAGSSELLKGANIDVSVACLKSAKFTLSATLDTLATSALEGDTCTGPSGMLALQKYDISYEYKDGSTTKSEHISFDCPDPSLDYSGAKGDVQAKIDACMNVINTTGQDQLRKAINRHADKLKISGVGTCSADACFSAKYTFKLKLEDGVVAVGGTCD